MRGPFCSMKETRAAQESYGGCIIKSNGTFLLPYADDIASFLADGGYTAESDGSWLGADPETLYRECLEDGTSSTDFETLRYALACALARARSNRKRPAILPATSQTDDGGHRLFPSCREAEAENARRQAEGLERTTVAFWWNGDNHRPAYGWAVLDYHDVMAMGSDIGSLEAVKAVLTAPKGCTYHDLATIARAFYHEFPSIQTQGATR